MTYATNKKLDNLIKASIVLCALWEGASLSGCGISLGRDITIGTTGFLEVAKKASEQEIEEHKETERAQLSRMVNR